MSRNADLWYLGYERTIKKRSTGLSIHSRRNRFSPKTKPGSAVKNFTSAAYKAPEVMVKIPKRKSSLSGMTAAKNHLDYISRNGKLDVEDQDGNIYKGKKQTHKEVLNQWKKLGIPETSKYRETLNVVLSMPPGTPPEPVKDAAREFAKETFQNHHYVFVQHTDQKHPHVHICVTMRDMYGERMNPRKNDLHTWRVLFAEKLREQGVECAATKRVHRGQWQKGVSSEMYHLNKRHASSYVEKEQFEELMQALKSQKTPGNPALKQQLDSRDFVVEQYKTLSQLLYKEGLKTEAKAIKQLAKELSIKQPESKAQQQFKEANQQIENHVMKR